MLAGQWYEQWSFFMLASRLVVCVCAHACVRERCSVIGKGFVLPLVIINNDNIGGCHFPLLGGPSPQHRSSRENFVSVSLRVAVIYVMSLMFFCVVVVVGIIRRLRSPLVASSTYLFLGEMSYNGFRVVHLVI